MSHALVINSAVIKHAWIEHQFIDSKFIVLKSHFVLAVSVSWSYLDAFDFPFNSSIFCIIFFLRLENRKLHMIYHENKMFFYDLIEHNSTFQAVATPLYLEITLAVIFVFWSLLDIFAFGNHTTLPCLNKDQLYKLIILIMDSYI